MSSDVAVVGGGPAADAAADALAEYDQGDRPDGVDDRPRVQVRRTDALDFAGVATAVVVGRVGDAVFEETDDRALEAGVPWVAVELGGVGGRPVADAAVTTVGPGGPCFECLATRVASNLGDSTEPVGPPGPADQRLAGTVAARRTLDVLTAETRSSVVGTVTELPYRERDLLPVPGCRCGDGRDFRVRRDADAGADSVEEAIGRAEVGRDERVGIVSQIGEGESYPAPYYLAQLCDTSGFSDAAAPRQAAGVGLDWNRAFVKAFGESYERYAAGVYTRSATRTVPANDLDAFVPPTAFVTPETPAWNESTELEWVAATDLTNGERTHVPADLVFHPPRERHLRPPMTTGLGLGSSGVDALLSGLYEVVERDASMIAWYSTFDPLGLDVENEEFRTLAARAASEDLAVAPVLLTQDVDVPVVGVAVHRESWPAFAVGSAAHLDPERAATGALEEALQNWMELRGMGPDDAADASGAIGEYATDPDPARAFFDADSTVPAGSVGPDAVPSGEAHLDVLVDRVADVDAAAYATRTTTRDLEAMGFEGVRVLVPEFQPLFLGEPYFGERVRSVPDALGFEPALDRPFHPFP